MKMYVPLNAFVGVVKLISYFICNNFNNDIFRRSVIILKPWISSRCDMESNSSNFFIWVSRLVMYLHNLIEKRVTK